MIGRRSVYYGNVDDIKTFIDLRFHESSLLHSLKSRYGRSYFYIQRVFREKVGKSIKEYIMQKKLSNSLKLLKNYRCVYVAKLLGFNYGVFHSAFKKYYGCTPSQYMIQNQNLSWQRRLKICYNVRTYIDAHLHEDPVFTKVAAIHNVSKRDLKTVFLKVEGLTVTQYIHKKKIERAKELLVNGKSVQEISEIMNYSNVPAFSSYFKRQTGYSPSKFYLSIFDYSIRRKIVPKLSEIDIMKIELFIRRNLAQTEISRVISEHFKLSVSLIDRELKRLRRVGLSKAIFLERLRMSVRLIEGNMDVHVVVKLVGLQSVRELLLDIINQGFMPISHLTKFVNWRDFFIPEDVFIQHLRLYIKNHLSERITHSHLCTYLQLENGEFKLLCKVFLGVSPSEFIHLTKMEVAKRLLMAGVLAKEVSRKLGYPASSTFSLLFKRYTGSSVRAYRKSKVEIPL